VALSIVSASRPPTVSAEASGGECGNSGELEAAGGFEEDEGVEMRPEVFEEDADANLSVGHAEALSRRPQGDVEDGLPGVDPTRRRV